MLKENTEKQRKAWVRLIEGQFRDLLREELKEEKISNWQPKWEAKVGINGYSQIGVVTKSLARCESS